MNRIPRQAHGERNYHVFYELLAGLPMEQKAMYLQETVLAVSGKWGKDALQQLFGQWGI